METKQYCIKKTPEEAQQEMEELTRREIVKLTEKIAQNPQLLRPKKFLGDSDEESLSDSSSDDDDTSVSSAESSESENHALVIYKKEQEIDRLSERNYYKALEMNNLVVEKERLKEELAKTVTESRNNARIIECFRKLFEYKNTMKPIPFIISEGTTIKEITAELVDIQSKFTSNIKLLTELLNETNSFEETVIPGLKQYFSSEIITLKESITKQHDSNYEILNKYVSNISEMKAKEISNENSTAVVVGMVLFFGLGVICNYFLK
jgi:hypothetical protein